MTMRVIRWTLVVLLALVVAGPSVFPGSKADGPIRRVNVPYFSGDVRFSQAAILWFGRVTPTTNYADVRVGYNDEELWVHVAVFDRRLWYDTAPSPETLAAWDSATLLIAADGNVGAALNASDYRFTGQLNWWEERAKWQAACRGNGGGWSPASLAFTTASTWRGDVPNSNGDDRGWGVTFHIPFSSLGRPEKPPTGTWWGFAVLVHDRDDAAVTPLSDQKWPEGQVPENPATWAQLVFGLPSYMPALARPRAVATIRQGLNGVVVRDAVVGGNSTCGSVMDYWTDWGNKNYAGLEYFNIQNQFDISDWPCFSKYYVTFPLDALPANKTVISATLQLHQFGNGGAGWNPGPTPSYIQVLTVADDWSETTLTWNNAPLAEQNIAGGWVDPLGDPVPPEGVDRQWDVSRAVAEAFGRGCPYALPFTRATGTYTAGATSGRRILEMRLIDRHWSSSGVIRSSMCVRSCSPLFLTSRPVRFAPKQVRL